MEKVDDERNEQKKQLAQADKEGFIDDAFNITQKADEKSFPSIDPWSGERLDKKTGKPLDAPKEEVLKVGEKRDKNG